MKSPATAYATAFIALGLAIAIRWLLDGVLGDKLPLVTLFSVVAIAVWLCGYRLALLVMLLGYLACAYLFIPPRGSLVSGNIAQDLAAFAAYTFTSILIIALGEAMRHARRRADERAEVLEVTLGSIGDAVIATDPSGRITFLNPIAESVTGWRREEAIGQPLDRIFRIINETTRRAIESPVVRSLREGLIVGLANHTLLARKDGVERPIDDSAAPIRDPSGRVDGCVLVFRDISERRRLEREAHEQAAATRLLASIVESSEDPIISKRIPEGIIQTWNPAAERLYGYTAKEIIGRPITVLIPHDQIDEEERITSRLLAGERIEHLETVRLRKDGTPTDVSLTISPIRDEAGRIIGASKIVRDISDRKKAERALRASEARKTAMFEAALDSVISMDHEGRVTEFNPAAERTFGYPREEVIGREMASLIIPPALRERHRAGLARYLATGEGRILGQRIEMPAVRADGSELIVELTVARIPVEGPPFFTAFLRDITERKRAERELEGAAQRKDEFLAILAHELRGPLAPLSHMLEVIKRSHGNEHLLQQARDGMQRQLSQLVRLVDDLLDVSRITRGKLELRNNRVELASILHQALEMTRPLADNLRHDIAVDLPSDPLPLYGDAARLTQVFSNLLNNACKFTPPGGRILLSARRQGDDVQVSVRDRGIGIPAETLPGSLIPSCNWMRHSNGRMAGWASD